jgi:hypothetical protein
VLGSVSMPIFLCFVAYTFTVIGEHYFLVGHTNVLCFPSIC